MGGRRNMKVKQGFQYRHRKIASLIKGKTLDIGFGSDPNIFLKGDVIGVDIILPDIKPDNYQAMIKGDVQKKLPFHDNSIDTILFSGIIEHLENPLNALREMNRVLKHDGRILIETPNPYFLPVIISDWLMWKRYYFNDTHINLFPRRIMLKMLWHTGYDLDAIKSCGINLTNYTVLRTPQWLAQDLIYIAIKRKPTHKKFKWMRMIRKDNYETMERRP